MGLPPPAVGTTTSAATVQQPPKHNKETASEKDARRDARVEQTWAKVEPALLAEFDFRFSDLSERPIKLKAMQLYGMVFRACELDVLVATAFRKKLLDWIGDTLARNVTQPMIALCEAGDVDSVARSLPLLKFLEKYKAFLPFVKVVFYGLSFHLPPEALPDTLFFDLFARVVAVPARDCIFAHLARQVGNQMNLRSLKAAAKHYVDCRTELKQTGDTAATNLLEWIANTIELGTHLLGTSHVDGGYTVAHRAAAAGHVDVLRWILTVEELGGDFLKRTATDGSTIAHAAVWNEHLDVLKWIASQPQLGAALLATSRDDGWTIAHTAAARGYVSVLRWIDRRPDLGPTFAFGFDGNGLTIQDVAVAERQPNVLQWTAESPLATFTSLCVAKCFGDADPLVETAAEGNSGESDHVAGLQRCAVATQFPVAKEAQGSATLVFVGHGNSGRREVVHALFQDACTPSRSKVRDHQRRPTVVVDLIDSPDTPHALLRCAVGSTSNPLSDSGWYDLHAEHRQQVVNCVDSMVAYWDESHFRDAKWRLHVRFFRPRGPHVRVVMPPSYNVNDPQSLAANIAAVRDASNDSQIFWTFSAPTDPANSSVRQHIIAACGVAERTTGVMTKCDLVNGEFSMSASTVIAAKLRTLRAGAPALGGDWIAMASACSVKEATAEWTAAGSPEGELERFKQANMLLRERATFNRLRSGDTKTDKQRSLIVPKVAFGAAALLDHIQRAVGDTRVSDSATAFSRSTDAIGSAS